jgi:hypothetical protein
VACSCEHSNEPSGSIKWGGDLLTTLVAVGFTRTPLSVVSLMVQAMSYS